VSLGLLGACQGRFLDTFRMLLYAMLLYATEVREERREVSV
jgi:hypothetical protein